MESSSGVSIRVEALSSNKSIYAYGEAIQLQYRTENVSDVDVYLIKDRVYRFKQGDSGILVMLGEIEQPNNFTCYEYQTPRFVRLMPKQVIGTRFQLGMPLTEPFVDKSGMYQEREIDLFGRIEIVLRIGFRTGQPLLETGERDRWAELVHSQQMITVGKVPIQINR